MWSLYFFDSTKPSNTSLSVHDGIHCCGNRENVFQQGSCILPTLPASYTAKSDDLTKQSSLLPSFVTE
jgi:hypothetical protein